MYIHIFIWINVVHVKPEINFPLNLYPLVEKKIANLLLNFNKSSYACEPFRQMHDILLHTLKFALRLKLIS